MMSSRTLSNLLDVPLLSHGDVDFVELGEFLKTIEVNKLQQRSKQPVSNNYGFPRLEPAKFPYCIKILLTDVSDQHE